MRMNRSSKEGSITKRRYTELIGKMIDRAEEISVDPDTFFTDQLNNMDVIEGFVPLGDEILQQLDG